MLLATCLILRAYQTWNFSRLPDAHGSAVGNGAPEQQLNKLSKLPGRIEQQPAARCQCMATHVSQRCPFRGHRQISA